MCATTYGGGVSISSKYERWSPKTSHDGTECFPCSKAYLELSACASQFHDSYLEEVKCAAPRLLRATARCMWENPHHLHMLWHTHVTDWATCSESKSCLSCGHALWRPSKMRFYRHHKTLFYRPHETHPSQKASVVFMI